MQQVISELERLRRRGRFMLIAQRAAVLIAWILGVAFALVIFDYALRLPGTFRMILLIGGVAAIGWGVWQYLRAAVLFQPTLTQLALRVENVLPSVAGRLASSVEFAGAGVDQVNPLANRSVRETQTRLMGESVSSVISPRRTWRDLLIMLGIVAVVAGMASFNPAAAQTGVTRLLLPYSDAKWPARTGVESLMERIIARQVHPRGQALPLRAAVTRGDLEQRVEAHYRLRVEGDFQPWQHIILTHQGGGVHERLVDTNAEQIEMYFATSDDQTEVESIMLVPPPSVRRAGLTVTPPPYAAGRLPVFEAELGQGLDDRAVTDTASLIGSQVRLQLELNKPLPAPPSDQAGRASWLRATFGWEESALPEILLDSDDTTTWTLQWKLSATRTLALNLVDEYGLRNAEPIAFKIEAVEDRVPAVTITQPQADEAVLASAVVGLEGEARDDVALASIGLEAHVQSGGKNIEESIAAPPAWRHPQEADSATATVAHALDLTPLHLNEGDVVLVTGVANDVYELDGARHETVRSPVRRLRVMNETEFATQLRRQLGAVRQNAIRIEALQGELQDDVIDAGVQPGMNRAQAQLGERIAAQREAVEDIERMLQQNRLDDAQLAEILQQTQDLLDFAGRSANEAVEAIEKRQGESAASRDPGTKASSEEQSTPARPNPTGPDSEVEAKQDTKQGQRPSSPPTGGNEPGQPSTDEGRDAGKPAAEANENREPEDKAEVAREGATEDREIIDSQQEVRDELTDLIKLLDRDEDTWVVKRQLENLAKQQAELEAATGRLGEQTIGQKAEDLTEKQRSELERIVQKQRDLAEEARKLIEEMRQRADAMKDIDPQSAEAMREAADTAEQQQLDRDMEQAAQNAEQNQMTSAQARQQQAQSTMQKMLENIAQTKRAQAQQLIRQLASLIESIQRLINVQENELTALALANDTKDYGGLDRNMIRLNQNTQAVAGEARAAGQEARRIARALDRAADSQGAAVTALRAQPINAVEAETAENRSLELLNEAKALAEELQKQTQEQETARRREELMEKYGQFAERQVALRTETLPLIDVEQLERRQLVEARRLGTSQDQIRTGLNELRDITSEIADSPVFTHVHRLIDSWSLSVTEQLIAGTVNVDATDRQQQIADSIGRLIEAIAETMAPPPEFAQDQQQPPPGGGQGQGQPPLIPPVAQLKLLQGLQEQVYDLTKDLDVRTDLDDVQRRSRLRDLGQEQRELMDLGQQMLEALQQQGGPPPEPEGEIPDQPEEGGLEPLEPVEPETDER